MKWLISTLVVLSSFSALANRKGPIFSLDEIPSQRSLLFEYAKFNALHTIDNNARLLKFEGVYRELTAEDFLVFKSREGRHVPNLDFSLAFQNHNMGFENKDKKNDQYGFCLGVTTELRKMNLLAFYDPENKYLAEVPSKEDSEAWLAFYKDLIDQVMINRPVIIPGFANLQELSGTPGLKEYMVRHVLNQWAMKNASIYSGFFQMLLGVKREYSKKEANQLYKEVRERIARHYPPRLFLSKKNYDKPLLGGQYIHVMEAFEISEMAEDGSYKIGVWHINNPWDKATYHVEIRADGTAWMEWRDLGELDIVPGDDAEIAEMVHHLKPFCEKYNELCL